MAIRDPAQDQQADQGLDHGLGVEAGIRILPGSVDLVDELPIPDDQQVPAAGCVETGLSGVRKPRDAVRPDENRARPLGEAPCR